MGQVVSRVKPLEPNTSQVGTLLWMLNHKKKKKKHNPRHCGSLPNPLTSDRRRVQGI